MNNEYENGFTPEENKTAESNNAESGVNSGADSNGAYNPYNGSGAYNQNTSYSNGQSANANGDSENGTTYHYAYNNAGPNNTNYYTAPNPPNQQETKKQRNTKEKTVEYDANGNPIKPKKNKTAIVIAIIAAVCVIAAIIGIAVSVSKELTVHPKKPPRLHHLQVFRFRTIQAMLRQLTARATTPLRELLRTA